MGKTELPRIVYDDAFCMVATWRSIVMPVMGAGKLPASSAKRQVAALEAHGKSLGLGKMGEITLIAASAALPEADTRAVLDGGVPIVSPYYGCVSAVFEGTGFKAALVRGILASFQLMSRTKFPQKVFSNVDDAAKWIYPHITALGMVANSAQDIIDTVHTVREIAVKRGIFLPPAEASASTSA